MPLLEATQTKYVSASIRLTDTTATQADQYAAFIHASADDVVEKALVYVFAKDPDFQRFLKSPQAQEITPTLRVRKPMPSEAKSAPKKSASSASLPAQTAAPGAGSKA